ncbi:hypothetical protein GCM10027610_082390 [Dactylosporangium cerinum]
MGVGVGVHADDRVNAICESFCQDGRHEVSSVWHDVRTASAREAVTQRHICDESRDKRGQASDQASKAGRAGAGDPRGQVR